MATAMEIYEFLDGKAPFSTQLDFDNAGFLAGRGDLEVRRILVALDITEEVALEAARLEAQLVVSHHPLIWGGAKSVTGETVTGRRLLALLEHGTAAICAHTNLDMAPGGVNDTLAAVLGLTETRFLQEYGTYADGRPYGLGVQGRLGGGAVPLKEFAAQVKAALGAASVRYEDAGKPVERVAVCGGSGGDLVEQALAAGCDTLVTADVRYDPFLDAHSMGLNLLDAGHYATEQVVCPVLAGWLREAFPQVEVLLSEHKEIYAAL
ncbi:MAG: Nif3-like dinuclear metal center hexameric protein [Oscillospiraceae bacterium]|nr:Nif3-like dinuclear metal center hexameric protein [Oscillospiraceae bacterium]